METEVRCPSGMVGKIRAIKVKDEKLFRDAKLIKSGKVIYELCKSVWLELSDSGPYEFHGDRVDWKKLLQGDAFWVFLQARILGYGNDYEFSIPCKSCREPIDHELNLSEDLIRKDLSQEGHEHIKTGQPIQIAWESNEGTRQIAFKLLRAEDDIRLRRLEDSRDMSQENALLALRLVSVEGVESDGRPFELIRFVEELDAGEADLLREQLEEYDCGVDTDVTLVCESCFYEQVVMLPFEESFFRKRKKQRTVRRTRARKDQSISGSNNTST